MIKNYKNLELKFSPEEGFSLFGTLDYPDQKTTTPVRIIHITPRKYDSHTKHLTFEASREFCEDITKLINEELTASLQKNGTSQRLSDIDESNEESATKKRMKEYFQKRNRDNALVTIKSH